MTRGDILNPPPAPSLSIPPHSYLSGSADFFFVKKFKIIAKMIYIIAHTISYYALFT